MQYRVEQLAGVCGISVDTVRFYQGKGLLSPPAREGRVAIYGAEHVQRIRRIRALQRKGLTLQAIRRVVSGSLARPDQDLVAAVADAQTPTDELLTLEELSERSGVPAPLLSAIENEGLALGRVVDGQRRYAASDVELVGQGLRLLEAGLPLTELLALAKKQNDSARVIAEESVRLFDTYVRGPIKATSSSDEEAAGRLVAAFDDLLPAVTALVANHFRRTLLDVAAERIEQQEVSSSATTKKEAAWRAR
ncbi:MAG: hypothetical protein NVSMB57_07230 [Actinomycetota bacterium]